MAVSEADFQTIRNFVYQQAAIVLAPGKEYLVEARLTPLAAREGCRSIEELVSRIRSQPPTPLHRKVVEAMTTNETSFFRARTPFEALEKVVLPQLLASRANEKEKVLNFWCAAASSGQEPYSIAMVLRERFPQLRGWTVRFLATDISREMLDRCRNGIYNQLEINRGLPPALLAKYFKKQKGEWQIDESLRKSIEFREMNIAVPWPYLPAMDVIFLRNVLIYFDAETKKSILSRVKTLLKPDGFFFLGTSEILGLTEQGLRPIPFAHSGCYQLELRPDRQPALVR